MTDPVLEPVAWLYERNDVKIVRCERQLDYTSNAIGFAETPLYTRPTDSGLVGELAALIEAATPGDLKTAEVTEEGGHIECPLCGGEGEVEQDAHYCNFDGVALGVQFYGIGDHFGAHEKLWVWLMKNRNHILNALTVGATSGNDNGDKDRENPVGAATTDIDELVERLEATHPKGGNYVMKPLGSHINPDGPKAVATLRKLSASKREGMLEAARIAEGFDDEDPDCISDRIAQAIRKAAGEMEG